jgi:magnesium transporter
MIRAFVPDNGRLRLVEGDVLEQLGRVLWIDLVNPTDEEERALEMRLGIDIPTLAEMQEIEVSSRLYSEDGASFMTATLPSRTDTDDLVLGPITFVLVAEKLITVRYHEPRAFKTFPQRAEQVSLGCRRGDSILIALLEAVVDRLADVLERVRHDVDELSRDTFRVDPAAPAGGRDFNRVLQQIGRKGDLASNVQDSLVSLQRLAGFFGQLSLKTDDKDLRSRIKTLSRDLQSLMDHTSFVSQKITFVLDATLGMINIEQNNIIKIFSIAAGVFLPPTLIASIYGMNFVHMPELRWEYGYPIAFVVMLASALLPFWWFRRRGWL